MIKEYSQNRSNVIMNFSVKFCDNSEELLNSFGFKRVLDKYIQTLQKKDAVLYDKITKTIPKESLVKTYTELFKLLLSLDKKDVARLSEQYKKMLSQKELLFDFIEGLYSYWRSLERYALIQSNGSHKGIQNVNFIDANNDFLNIVLNTYRRIEENILGEHHKSAGSKRRHRTFSPIFSTYWSTDGHPRRRIPPPQHLPRTPLRPCARWP